MPDFTDAVSRKNWEKHGERVSVLDFGALADGVIVQDGAITSAGTTFSSASAAFTSADVGKLIWIEGAGAAGASYTRTLDATSTTDRDLLTTIVSINSSTSVEVADAASATVSDAESRWGTDNTDAIQAAFNETLNRGLRIWFPRGVYLTSDSLTVTENLTITGEGWTYHNYGDGVPKIPSVICCCADVPLMQATSSDGQLNGLNCQDINFRGTSRPGSLGIYLWKALGPCLNGCTFSHFGDNAILFGVDSLYGCHLTGLMANDCMLADDRTDYIGVFDIGCTDAFIQDCEAGVGIVNFDGGGASLGDFFGTGYIAAWAVRGNNSWMANCMGALAQVGVYVGSPEGIQIVSTFVNVRADQCQGHGFVIDAGNCNFVACRSHANYWGADGTYNGFHILGGSHQFNACQVTALIGDTSNPHYHRYNDCFHVESEAGIPPSVFNLCTLGNAYTSDPTVGFTGSAYAVAGSAVNPIIVQPYKHAASSQWEQRLSQHLNIQAHRLYLNAASGAADTTLWSIGADVGGLAGVFGFFAWTDDRSSSVSPIRLYRNTTTGAIDYLRFGEIGAMLINSSVGYLDSDTLFLLRKGIAYLHAGSYADEGRWFVGPNADAGTVGTGQFIGTTQNDAVTVGKVWLRVLRNGADITYVELCGDGGYIKAEGDLKLSSGKILYLDPKTIIGSSGTPEGSISAYQGSLYLDANGIVWLKQSGGTGNTGWVQLAVLPAYTGTDQGKTLHVGAGPALEWGKVVLDDAADPQVQSSFSDYDWLTWESNNVKGTALDPSVPVKTDANGAPTTGAILGTDTNQFSTGSIANGEVLASDGAGGLTSYSLLGLANNLQSYLKTYFDGIYQSQAGMSAYAVSPHHHEVSISGSTAGPDTLGPFDTGDDI